MKWPITFLKKAARKHEILKEATSHNEIGVYFLQYFILLTLAWELRTSYDESSSEGDKEACESPKAKRYSEQLVACAKLV